MKSLVIGIFGIYVPVVTLAEDGVTEIVASGVAGVDWPWVAGVVLFAIVLWSFFRLVGVIARV